MTVLSIDTRAVPAMRSPASFIFNHVSRTVSTLSPEVKQGLLATGIHRTVNCVENNRFICGVKDDVITVSTRTLEVLWAIAHLNAIYFHLVREKGGLGKSVEMNPAQEPELLIAMQLVDWLINAWLNPEAPQEWPENLPKPREDAAAGSWEFVANEITRIALGYLLLHEVAHVVLEHGPSDNSTWSINQEKEADRQATEWLFAGHPDSGSSQRIARGLAVASALIAQVARGLWKRDFGGNTHPAKWQRLDQVLKEIESDELHPLFAFISQLVPLYRTMSGQPSAPGTSPDYLSAFDSQIDELSRLDRKLDQ